jgi:hypothetical protein|tara:strand:+ start:213 stop:452 length:240 start_codon:yes stop_codon:yes gene_type:complete
MEKTIIYGLLLSIVVSIVFHMMKTKDNDVEKQKKEPIILFLIVFISSVVVNKLLCGMSTGKGKNNITENMMTHSSKAPF